MTKFIIKTNEWYESLSNIKAGLFYLSLIFVPYLILLFTLTDPYFAYMPLVWVFIVALWRASYGWIIELRKIKEMNTKVDYVKEFKNQHKNK